MFRFIATVSISCFPDDIKIAEKHRLKTGPGHGPWTLEKTKPLKNGTFGKTGPQGLKKLPSVSCHMKDKVINFHMKSRIMQGLVFVEITFEKYTTNFHFENAEVGIKTIIANL